ncbi:hypothetical protein [Micromonospora sp. WMMD998]|uniref:hypothetical protein n=1 Tax=Micromonospora sp. WMMD998 TaxID=3016092 RepID=UPI00249B5A02|nr:hypothetical protein [Micromonospora sp. WMMD998]WFE41969.1 hypothetical protein O7619_27375 [Micromonospora sp. WMMD998]
MNFGFRLPGPFRVGVSSKGRVNVGVTVGPLSASGGLGGAGQRTTRGTFFPVTMPQFVEQARAEGFTVTQYHPSSATIERRWKAGRAEVVPGQGVMLRQVWSTWQTVVVIAAVLAVPLVCCLPGYLVNVNH